MNTLVSMTWCSRQTYGMAISDYQIVSSMCPYSWEREWLYKVTGRFLQTVENCGECLTLDERRYVNIMGFQFPLPHSTLLFRNSACQSWQQRAGLEGEWESRGVSAKDVAGLSLPYFGAKIGMQNHGKQWCIHATWHVAEVYHSSILSDQHFRTKLEARAWKRPSILDFKQAHHLISLSFAVPNICRYACHSRVYMAWTRSIMRTNALRNGFIKWIAKPLHFLSFWSWASPL